MEGLFRGTWYRSAVKLERVTTQTTVGGEKKKEEDRIVPIPPFEPYNPFDWHYSASDIRQGQRSLYLDFLAVDSDNPEEVRSFCQRFGMLGNPMLFFHQARDPRKSRSGKRAHPIKVIEDTLEANYLFREGNPDTKNLPPEKLCFPMFIFEFRKLQDKFIDAITFFKQFPTQPTQISEVQNLSDFINQKIRDSRIGPQVAWNEQKIQWELVWNSVDLTGYLYLMLMLDLLGPGKILSCPRCHRFFVTASNRQKFCELVCNDNFKVQKYQRKKKAEKLAAQQGKKVKTAKSTGKKR